MIFLLMNGSGNNIAAVNFAAALYKTSMMQELNLNHESQTGTGHCAPAYLLHFSCADPG